MKRKFRIVLSFLIVVLGLGGWQVFGAAWLR